MRTSATLFVALITSFTVAQTPGDTLTMYFDAPGEPLQLDSVYPAGCWQVGTPAKPVFTSAYSPGKALVTDTLLPHPVNTTCYAEYTLLSTDFNYLGRTIQYKQWLHMDTTSQASVEVYDPWLGDGSVLHRGGMSGPWVCPMMEPATRGPVQQALGRMCGLNHLVMAFSGMRAKKMRSGGTR